MTTQKSKKLDGAMTTTRERRDGTMTMTTERETDGRQQQHNNQK
jgi:hypothetical protein